MEEHECPLRGLNICDGHLVATDWRRPNERRRCICAEERDVVDQEELAQDLRWLRARTVARSHPLQRAIDRWRAYGQPESF